MISKKLVITIFIILFISINFTIITIKSQEISTTKYIYVGGNQTGNYSTIQGAINQAENGDIIYIYNGIYYETINIYKSLKITGENKEKAILYNKSNYNKKQ